MQNQPQYIAFDKKAVFDEEIQPVLEHLTSLLRHYDIPYFFAAAIKSDESGTEYVFESEDNWSTASHMKDDKIPGFIKVVNGFRTVLPEDILEVDL